MTRKVIGKRIRFDVFKRDGFACQYCGAKAPSVLLVIDHIHPVSKGGTDEAENLITSCDGCNIGKSNGLLNKTIPSAAEKAERIAEAEEQLKEYQIVLRAKKRRENRDIDKVQDVFRETWSDRQFTETFRDSIRNNFLPHFAVEDLLTFMRIACQRVDEPSRAIKYFCGVCWNNIRKASGAQ